MNTSPKCLVCGEPTVCPIRAILWHFRPIEHPRVWFGYLRGTYRLFGLRSVVTLVSPFLNTVIHWKYRHHRLKFPKEFTGCDLRR